jgi:hypothetical protein
MLSVGCTLKGGPDPDVAAVKERASFETSCPKSEIRTRWLDEDGNMLGVSACGEKLVYVRRFGHDWVLNSSNKD